MEQAKKVMYRWIELWDGGKGSELFETKEQALDDATAHVRSIRWTKREMEEAIKKVKISFLSNAFTSTRTETRLDLTMTATACS